METDVGIWNVYLIFIGLHLLILGAQTRPVESMLWTYWRRVICIRWLGGDLFPMIVTHCSLGYSGVETLPCYHLRTQRKLTAFAGRLVKAHA
jgi:uncharacterized membrane-anchored protein